MEEIKLDNLLSGVGDVALRRRAKWLIESLDIKKGEKILDLGCGDGFYLHLLSKLDPTLKLTGIDNNTDALKSAKQNLKGAKVNLIRSDALKLPFPVATFDKIIASEVLEHVKDDIAAIKEIRRVLKDRGIFVLSVPYKDYPFFWDPINWILEHWFNMHIKSGFWAGIWNQHLRLYKQNNLQNSLEKSGFKRITFEKLTHYCLPFNHYLINIVARILAARKDLGNFRSSISKFSTQKGKSSFSIFSPVFFIDGLNDIWDGKGGAVSLVAKAVK